MEVAGAGPAPDPSRRRDGFACFERWIPRGLFPVRDRQCNCLSTCVPKQLANEGELVDAQSVYLFLRGAFGELELVEVAVDAGFSQKIGVATGGYDSALIHD